LAFVNLNKKLEKSDKIYTKSKSNFKKRMIKIIALILIVLSLIYFPVRGVYSSGKRMIAGARQMQESVKNNDLDGIKKGLAEIKAGDSSLNTSLNFLIWVRIIPFVGSFYADAVHFSKAAGYELQAAEVLVNSLDPYKDEIGLNGTPTPGQDKIAQFVKILDKTLPHIDQVEPQLKQAADEVASIDVNKYPETFGRYRLRSQVETGKNFITGAHYAITEAKDALMLAPSALGEPSKKTYLLLFQNDKELRPTGGFLTAYAYLTLDKGRLTSSESDDIYRLDEKLLNVCKSKICPLTPPAPLVKYLPEADGRVRTAWSMRDSNISPDVPTSMTQFEKMYNMLGEGTPWDGIILIDTHVVEELIKITGPIEVFGTTYSADNDPRCNCPNVIYELEAYAQIVEKGQEDRKAILGTLMQQILARSLGAATDKLPEFINAGVKLAEGKHLMFYMKDQPLQTALTKLDWTGDVKPYTYDYFMINDANFAGGKTNLYVQQSVKLDINIDDSGKVTHKADINYNNPQIYDRWLNGINRTYVRLYAPKGSKLISSKGSESAVTTIEDLDKTVFEAFIQVRPANSRQLIFEYELPEPFTGKDYDLLIQKQPGTKDFEYEIKVNGNTKEKFNLDTDKQLKISI
jgi:hypothetical protein